MIKIAIGMISLFLGCQAHSPTASTENDVSTTHFTNNQLLENHHVEKPGAKIRGKVTLVREDREIPLAGAVVYVLNSSVPLESADPERPATLTIRNGHFEPPHQVVQVNQPLIIVEDDEPHYWIITSRHRPIAARFDLPSSNARIKEVFDKAEPCVVIRCSIHPGEIACVTVVPNSYHAKADLDGSFQLPLHLPKGQYTLRSFHQDLGKLDIPIEVKSGDRNMKVDFQYGDSSGNVKIERN